MQRTDYLAEGEPIQPMVKKGRAKEKGKDKGTAKKEKQSAEGRDKKKGKGKKGKEAAVLADDPELAEAEIQYYATIQKASRQLGGHGFLIILYNLMNFRR